MLFSHDLHGGESCRSIAFSDNGGLLFTSSSDKSLRCIDVATHAISFQKLDAHEHKISRICNIPTMNLLASGDDDGVQILGSNAGLGHGLFGSLAGDFAHYRRFIVMPF